MCTAQKFQLLNVCSPEDMVPENLHWKYGNSHVLREWASFLQGGVTCKKCLPAFAVVLRNGANLQNDANYIFCHIIIFWKCVVCLLWEAVWSALGSFECLSAKAGLYKELVQKKKDVWGFGIYFGGTVLVCTCSLLYMFYLGL